VPIATIGLMSELALAYKFKFVWAPFLDPTMRVSLAASWDQGEDGSSFLKLQ
jgi:hypothetical protein